MSERQTLETEQACVAGVPFRRGDSRNIGLVRVARRGQISASPARQLG
jgi:hypothetical protein